MTKFYYQKLFTSGNLKGITVNCEISFENTHRAQAWTRQFCYLGYKGSDAVTRARYTIVYSSFQPIEPVKLDDDIADIRIRMIYDDQNTY